MKKSLLFLFCLTIAGSVSAESMFRCGSSAFINVGDSSGKVRAKCGEPLYKDGDASGETWAYRHPNTGRGAELRFRNGKLVNIEDIGRMD